MVKKLPHIIRRLGLIVLVILQIPVYAANDTILVRGGIQHDGLLDWKPVMYHSNSYLDLGVHWQSERKSFRELRATTRLELNQWPMPGYEPDFEGYGMSHLSIAAAFTWGEITAGDVYGQFGSGLVLSLREDRALGIDGALRGAKISITPYHGIHLTALGGKQRRYWNCYTDKAFGWNYSRDAVIAADAEIDILELISHSSGQQKQREILQDIHWTIAGSWVSKYEQMDTIIARTNSVQFYMYNLPRWVGATDVRTRLQIKGFDILGEFAYKFNDPGSENQFTYDPGIAALFSAGYSQKGLSVLLQMKFSENMSFRSERLRTGLAGRLNHMPAFAQQHTYALAALYPYATQYTRREWAMQAEVRYTWPKKSKMGGRYGTTMKLSAAHIRVPVESQQNEAYTDVNVELNKRINKRWWLNAMLMYQAYNQLTIEGHGGMIRNGIAVLDTRVQVNNKVSMRGELQYLYSPNHEGQWLFALYELNLFRHWTVSGQWMYNIGHAPDATNAHYYTAGLTFNYGAHRANIGYTKTREGFNCSGGVCRYIPQMEGVAVNYSFTF